MANNINYRSWHWWSKAIFFQLRIILQIRKIKVFLRMEEKFTLADEITMYVIKYGQDLYKIIVSKYPEYR